MMLNNDGAFLAALDANEDDEATRLIYADWLEEQGEYEEAERQRKWTGAKAWLVKLLGDCCRGEVDDDPDAWHPNPSFSRLCQVAQQALAEMERLDADRVVMDWGANESLTVAMRALRQDFWQNWAIVTGVRVPHDLWERSYFGCSC